MTAPGRRRSRISSRPRSNLAPYNATPPQADGFYAIGDIRRLTGDFEGAEAALREAHARGRRRSPLSRSIRLAEGKVKAAACGDRRRRDGGDVGPLGPGSAPPAQVEILDRGWRRRTGADSGRRLAGIVTRLSVPGARGGRRWPGRVLLAEGDASGASHELGRPSRDGATSERPTRWLGRGSSCHSARASTTRTSRPGVASGADEFRGWELPSTRSAERDSRSRTPAGRSATGPHDLHVHRHRRLHQLAEAIGDQAWERLLRWHDDVLRASWRAGEGRSSTRPGTASSRLRFGRSGHRLCPSIQRTLVEHRAASGFALPVRIGLHSAEASRQGDDYSGIGVHVAARVGALAKGGEILATADRFRKRVACPTSDHDWRRQRSPPLP